MTDQPLFLLIIKATTIYNARLRFMRSEEEKSDDRLLLQLLKTK